MSISVESYANRLRTHLPQILTTLVPDEAEKVRREFLADPTQPLQLTYREKLGQYPFTKQRQELSSLFYDSKTHLPRPLARLYEDKVTEALQRLTLLEYAATDDQPQEYTQTSKTIFGEPSPEALATTLGTLRNHLTELDSSAIDTSNIQSVLDKSHLTAIDPRPLLRELGISASHSFDHEPVVTHQEAVRRIEEKLAEGLAPGWELAVDTTGARAGMMADTQNRLIRIPRADVWEQRQLRETSFTGKLLHEFTHARRAANGLKKSVFLEIGPAYPFEMEEAASTWSECTHVGADDFPNYDYMLGVALAGGYFDGYKRSFCDVYDLLVPALYLERTTQNMHESHDKKFTYAQNRAYEVTLRTFRGTNGITPGAHSFKDVIYRNGAVKLWKLIATDQWVQDTLFLGEFDPSKPAHTEPLIELGFLPKRY